MRERIRAPALLRRAAALFDDPRTGLMQAAADTRRWGFRSGGAWMRVALRALRQPPDEPHDEPHDEPPFRRLGFTKYGLAGLGALAGVSLARRRSPAARLLLGAAIFYAIEAQMVFLFPLAIDGTRRPFAEGLRWTARAGGAAVVVPIILQLAGRMIFGGLLGGGTVRSWCLGCLAVCLWYEGLRTGEVP